MTERELRKSGNKTAIFQNLEICFQSYATEHKNCSRLNDFELRFQVLSAIAEFGGKRLVLRRRAADGRRDVSIMEREAVTAMSGGGLICKTGAMESVIEKVS